MAMSARWFIEADGQRYRVDPDAGLVVSRRNGVMHPRGCLCPDCAELRAAVGKGMYEYAESIAARQRGRIAAEQEITAQRRREAAARAEVACEMAGYGAYPYRVAREAAQDFLGKATARGRKQLQPGEAVAMHLQRLEGPWPYKRQDAGPHPPCTCRDPKPGTPGVEDRPYAHDRACRRNHGQFSGTPGWRTDHGKLAGGIGVPSQEQLAIEAADCTCKPPAWNPGSPHWAAHKPECPMRARLCREGATRSVREKARTEPVLTPEQEIRAALEAFDAQMLGGPQYPAWMEPGSTLAEPGRCRECRWGYPAADGGLCLYCKLRAAAVRESPRNQELRTSSHDRSGWAVMAVVAVMMAAAAVLYSQPVVLVPVLILGLLALLRKLP